ncbi:hypothetical protein AD949_00110 [Acetobacter orleanensis]|nr:hypothetical protein AD949_00110 [Acetobacter orleanensis]PCD78195.1 hypothetical protein CO710_13665 [Acetobacter orleanensis]GAN69691.1 hypothetical protein Abol_052_003 [Acetobacter orleanensis JCM 7639]
MNILRFRFEKITASACIVYALFAECITVTSFVADTHARSLPFVQCCGMSDVINLTIGHNKA